MEDTEINSLNTVNPKNGDTEINPNNTFNPKGR